MTEPRWLSADQHRAWRSLLTVFHRAMPELERTFKAHDLLAVHYQVFVELSEAPGRTMRLNELAAGANLSPSRLTHRLRPLIDRGEVAIAPCPHDGRAKNATITDAGLARLQTVAPIHVEEVQRLIFDHLGEAQTAALADALSVVSDALCQQPELLNPRDGST